MKITRTLHVNILSIFLIVIAASIIFVTSYSYYRQHQAVLSYAIDTIGSASNMAREKLITIQDARDDLVQSMATLLTDPSAVRVDNKIPVNFGLTLLKVGYSIISVFFANESGDFLAIISLDELGKKSYFVETKPPPPNTKYLIEHIYKVESAFHSTIQFLDKNFSLISQEVIKDGFDARQRPWYIGSMKAQGLYWTDPYSYLLLDRVGIAVAAPMRNDSKQFIGAAGVTLSFKTLRNFLSSLRIGKSGIACILDKTGEPVVPVDHNLEPLIHLAYEEFLSHQSPKFIFESNGIKYLAGFELLNDDFHKEWTIAVIVPMNDFFGNLITTEREIILVSIAILLLTSLLVYYFSKSISSPIVEISKEINKITQLDFANSRRIPSNIIEIQHLDSSTSALRSAMRSFEKYLPKEVVRLLLSRDKEIELGGEKKDITIFFTDVQDFTTISETLPTDALMILLEEYFDALSKIILEEQGTIDKYIGDSIMAFWGAPLELKDHTLLACKAAIACRARVNQLNIERKSKGQPEFFTRIGITTGVAIVGNIGTNERMNYTVIGDIVNTASRLQGINKIYHTSIIISEDVRTKIQDKFLTRPLDLVSVKGKMNKVSIFELVGSGGEAIEELCRTFQEAYRVLKEGDLQRALTLFEQIHQKYPEDYPTQMYIERIQGSIAK